MRRIVLSHIDLTIRQQALSLAIMVVGIRVNKAVPRDKGRASHSPLIFVVGQYPPDLIRSGVGGPATALSGGQQKLVALARALLVGQRLLLLDEPSEGVAPVLARRIWSILRNLRTEGVSTLIAESNVHHIANFVDGIFTAERGAVTAGLGARDRRSKNAMQPGRQHPGGMQ